MARLTADYGEMAREVEGHLSVLERIMHWERLKVLLLCRKRVTFFHERVVNIRECIKEILDSDADMAAMYLSDIKFENPVFSNSKSNDNLNLDHTPNANSSAYDASESLQQISKNKVKDSRDLTKLTDLKVSLRGDGDKIRHGDSFDEESLESKVLKENKMLKMGRKRRIEEHEEVELMLESYLKTAEELASRTQILASNMSSTEDIVNIGLMGQRNEMLLLELRLGIGTFAASMGGFGASILGMNLNNGFESVPGAFWVVFLGLTGISGVSFVLGWRRLSMLVRKF